jgi:CheY-like chemotaxis protein
MRYRIMDILLACSPYDAFILEEAGQLSERVLGEFRNLDLHYGPGLTGVTNGAEVISLAREQPRFNLIVTALQLPDMNARELAERVAAAGLAIPVVGLAFDNRELKDFVARHGADALERVFLWQGDARILLAIVKYVEDRRNAPHDTAAGVQVILLVEDNVRYYSSFLPTVYAELLHHSQRHLAEGVNSAQRILRMRARPKLLLCTSYEEAWEAFTRHRDEVLGVISDIEFPRGGRKVPLAGITLAERIREMVPDVPVVLHSSRAENAELAERAGAGFLQKGSPLLLHELRRLLSDVFSFGDFVFRTPAGAEVGRASDLRSLEQQLRRVPVESVSFHAERNHFSRWLKARTEFAVARALRPRRPADYPDPEALRHDLVAAIAAYRRERSHGAVADFDRARFEPTLPFHRIGGGSLGGKARGLTFVQQLLDGRGLLAGLPGATVTVPPAVVVATDVFERFLDDNGLRDFATLCEDDEELGRRFMEATFPADAALDLEAFVAATRWPLAVRSSSLLEDSRYQPFTGVYDTYMLPNDAPDPARRLDLLVRAVKRIYASTFTRRSKAYIRSTPYRLEEEKMAVLLQRLAGTVHGTRFYPDFSGVARSHNYYPAPNASAADGVAAVALGLGRTVVEGGRCVRFSPRHPRHPAPLSSVRELLDATQRDFWALDLSGEVESDLGQERSFPIEVADADGTLAALASTWSAENDAVYDGVARSGVRVVTFAPILKQEGFPLAALLDRLLQLGVWAMGAAVEMEFAVDLRARELSVLQIRPAATPTEENAVDLEAMDPAAVLCRSRQVLGNGTLREIHDVVVVDRDRFDRGDSRATARDVALFNAELVEAGRPYLLIGVGRWGSRDPWLGIPVAWDQVSGARVIVEAGLRDVRVTPSQGTHFFQNLTTFNVGYFTVNPELGDGRLDWDWLAAQPAEGERGCVRHLRFEAPLVVHMKGTTGEGVILRAG